MVLAPIEMKILFCGSKKDCNGKRVFSLEVLKILLLIKKEIRLQMNRNRMGKIMKRGLKSILAAQ